MTNATVRHQTLSSRGCIWITKCELALNRHIHRLEEAGYLRARKYFKDYGFDGGEPRAALNLKQELIEEICKRFEPAIADYLEHPREQLWPVHNEKAVAAQIRQHFPEGMQ